MAEGFVAVVFGLGGLVLAHPLDHREEARRERPRRAPTSRSASAAPGAAAPSSPASPAAVGLAVVYSAGGQPQVEGVLLAIALGGIGVGLVSWAKRFMPDDVAVEARGTVASADEDVARPSLDDFGAGEAQVGAAPPAGAHVGRGRRRPRRRRPVPDPLARARGRDGACTPRPIAEGDLRLVTEEGEPVRADDLAVDGVLTVFPEGYDGAEDAPDAAHHLPEGSLQPRPGREDWTVGGLCAFSKICTHAGCPVGLFEAQTGQLLCPCHQSTFDVKRRVPADLRPRHPLAAPAPPRPSTTTATSIATGDFSDPVGPGFWDRGR